MYQVSSVKIPPEDFKLYVGIGDQYFSRSSFYQSKVTNIRMKKDGGIVFNVDRPCNKEGCNLADALNKVFGF